jgi:hypothetical protein
VEKSREKLTAFLEGALTEEPFKRLRQVVLLREGLFALSHQEVMKELEITDPQRQQFGEVVQAMQKKIEPLMTEADRRQSRRWSISRSASRTVSTFVRAYRRRTPGTAEGL